MPAKQFVDTNILIYAFSSNDLRIPGMTGAQEYEHQDIAAATRAQVPHSYQFHGFTTVVDLDSTPTAMADWKGRNDPVPDAYYCGAAALMDGYPMNFVPKSQHYRATIRECDLSGATCVRGARIIAWFPEQQ